MQSKTSFFNLALFKKNISRTWIVGLLYFILLVILMPIQFIITMANYDTSWYASSGYDKNLCLLDSMSYIGSAGYGAVVAIVLAGITFWYLFSKRDNYMMHAFPVTRKSLYFTGFISCSIVGIVPVVLNSIIMTIAAAAERAYSLDAIWYWAFSVIVSTELFLSIAMFSLMTSGQLVTAVLFYILFNYLYILIEVAFRLTASILLFGMSQSMNYINYNPWTPISFIPSNCCINVFKVYDDFGNVSSYTYTLSGLKYLLIYLLAAVIITGIAYVLYKYKKLETVQDFIAVPFLKPVFTVGMSFFISMVAGALVAGMLDAIKVHTYSTKFIIAIIATLIIGCIVFYASQMLIEKTLRVFSSKKFGFLIGYSFATLVLLIFMRVDLLKIENKVPAADDIQWVGVSNTYTMVFSDPEEINSIRELHKNIIDDKKEMRDVNVIYSDVPGSILTIKYKLKNGNVVARDYSVVDTDADQVSATYLAATEPFVDYLNNPTRIKVHVIGNIWNNCDVTDMSFGTCYYDEEMNDYFYGYNTFDDLSEKEKIAKNNKVYKALLKDIDDGKVFLTSFGADYDYSYKSNLLYNSFDFTVSNKEIPYFSDQDTFWDSRYYNPEPMYEQNITVQLNSECTNTLKALYNEGFYDDEEQVITYAEYNKKMGYDQPPEYELYD